MKRTGNSEQRAVGRSRSVSSSGFTLLELLISMTIVSLLATTVLFGWRIAVSGWQKASTHLERSRTVMETNRLLEEQMASMVPYRVPSSFETMELFFQGESKTARFLSRYSLAGRSSSGLYRVEYQIADGPGGTRQLLLNEIPVRSAEELTPLLTGAEVETAGRLVLFSPFQHSPETRVFLEGLQDCRFEYYRPATASEPGSWTDRWVGVNGELPRAMAIRIEPSEGAPDLKSVSIVTTIRNYSFLNANGQL